MAGSGGTLTWSTTSVTLAVGETKTVNYTTTFVNVQSADFAPLIASVATFTEGTNKIDLTGTAAGTVTIAANTTVGFETVTTNALTITVTSADDQNFLNERGLARFWDNIDDIKQNKLTAGAGISITNDVISATGGGVADSVAWGHITGSMSNQTDLTTALAAKANSADLATVATSGSYNDLSNKPTIPAKQVFYGTCDSSGRLSNKTVACSGFTYAEGNVIYVTFSDADTYSGDSGMTMNVNSTGAKYILTQTTSGGGLQSDYKWAAGETVCFVCHNDYYLMVEAAMATPTTSGLMSVNDKNKLDGIAAGAEVNVRANWTESDSSSDAYIQNKPNLATVATSGSYGDLSNKPTIPAAQVQSNWAQTTTTAVDYIKNKPALSAVATSGSYNDLSNKPTVPEIKRRTNATTVIGISPLYVAGDGTTTYPMALKTHGNDRAGSFAYININEPTDSITEAYAGGYVWDMDEDWWRKMSEVRLALYSDIPTVPTVNDATLTIQKNGTNVATFTANASSNVTADISVPTLYTTTGQNTDGAVTQKLFTDTVGNVETILQTLNNGGGAQ